ncbi:MAG: ferric reductase-like transmembrane domain-containing protein [Candidatus Paceibacterota bacterium]|jgi:predicted ferric reductase
MKKVFLNSILVINLCLILYFWSTNSNYLITGNDPGGFLIALGRLAGLLTELLIITQLFLISRFSFIEKEYGFDKLVGIHKKVGMFIGVFIISHPLLLTIGYAKINNVSFIKQFINFQTNWEEVFSATIAAIIIILIAIISIKKIRNKIPYEVWYLSHLPIYFAIAIAFEHQIQTGDMSQGGAMFYWYLINLLTISILISYRFIKPLYLFLNHQFVVEKIIKENHNVYSIYLTGRNMKKYKFQSGQYATLIFMQKNMWFHHPFSFSDTKNGRNLRFSIKSSGDFTSKIEKINVGTRVWMDGPLGTFTLDKSVKKKFLFIAGGIGITPILSILKSIPNNKDSILMYSNKTQSDIIFHEEINRNVLKTYYFNTNETGERINIGKIKEICPDYKDRDIYICGPVQMKDSIVKELRSNNLTAKQIHFEKFDY